MAQQANIDVGKDERQVAAFETYRAALAAVRPLKVTLATDINVSRLPLSERVKLMQRTYLAIRDGGAFSECDTTVDDSFSRFEDALDTFIHDMSEVLAGGRESVS